MKRFITVLSLLAIGVLSYGAGTVSAASVTQAEALAAKNNVTEVQGYGGGGGGGGYGGGYEGRRGGDKSFDDDDDDDNNDNYSRRRYRRFDDRGDYCFNCARRCGDGWCPPRCWGWQRYCRPRRSY